MSVESTSNPDATLDNPFGYKAELKKKFGFLSMLGVGFVITGCVLYTAASVPNL
jgi:hypothetical protein